MRDAANAPNERATRFLAIVGHADDASLLDACIAHHLAIGADAVLVVPMRPDDATRAVLDRHVRDERVRAFDAEPGTQHGFDYFLRALDAARAWRDPEWILFLDSDEFWIPASGTLSGTAGLAAHDVFAVERYNVPPLRTGDGTPVAESFRAPARLTMLVGRGDLEASYRRGDTRLPIVEGRDRSPKVLVRASAIAAVSSGGHGVTGTSPLRESVADDLLILHAPFTTRARFDRKLAGIRASFARYADRFRGTEAWHWRFWAALERPDELAAEFARQTFDAAGLDAARRAGRAFVARDFFAVRAAVAPRTVRERARLGAAAALRALDPREADAADDADLASAPWFDPWSFRMRYAAACPGLATATDADAFALYTAGVRDRGFSPNALFDEERYRRANPDVTDAVRAGVTASGFEHFVRFGAAEGRANLPGYDGPCDETAAVLGLARRAPYLVTWFDDAFYRAAYPDVARGVAAGTLPSALEHFLAAGHAQGRLPHPAARTLRAARDDRDAWAFAETLATGAPLAVARDLDAAKAVAAAR